MPASDQSPRFLVQDLIDNVHAFAHHKTISELWSTKWRPNCSLGIYPFVDGKLEDFEPIFEALIRRANDNVSILSDPDAYAVHFLPVGENLVHAALAAEASGNTASARELFLRAAAVYRIARFPIVRSPLGRRAWAAGKAAYLRGAQYLDPPVHEVLIPFAHANVSAGDRPEPIPAYLRVPKGVPPPEGWPVVLFICGLDSYRTDNTDRLDRHLAAGFATLALEIPGTGDCPAAPGDASAPERLWGSVLDWLATAEAARASALDAGRVVARGISTGAYYAVRLAHTHPHRLAAAVAQGAWAHAALEPRWLRAVDHMEYPFELAAALACKFGYASVEAMLADDVKGKFSLENGGILDMPSCRLLVVNGMRDSVFPIEDSMLVASRGRVKDVRFMEGKGHMGNPGAELLIIDWINEVMAEPKTEPKTYNA